MSQQSPPPPPPATAPFDNAKCICQLCNCGQHSCPHNDGKLFDSGHHPVQMSEYAQTYVTKEGQHRQPMMRPQTQGDYSSKEAMQPNTTHTDDYQHWQLSKSTPYRPVDTLYASDAPFDATTTNRSDFLGRQGAAAVRSIRPSTTLNQSTNSPFEQTTTHRNDFVQKQSEPVKSFKPNETAFRSDQPFDATTMHMSDYRGHAGARRPDAIRPRTSRYLVSDAPFDAMTEHQSKFVPKQADSNPSFKPANPTYRPSSVAFDSDTTYRNGYVDRKGERAVAIPPAPSTLLQTGLPFDSITTNRHDFVEKKPIGRCPAEMLLNHRDRSFQLIGDQQGHRWYQRVGRGGVDDAPNRRQLAPVQG